jgi:sec-independent protein translocase protein TatC
MSQNQTPEADKEDGIQETFLSHLFELRDRLIKAVGALLLVFLSLVYWAPDIFICSQSLYLMHCPVAAR